MSYIPWPIRAYKGFYKYGKGFLVRFVVVMILVSALVSFVGNKFFNDTTSTGITNINSGAVVINGVSDNVSKYPCKIGRVCYFQTELGLISGYCEDDLIVCKD